MTTWKSELGQLTSKTFCIIPCYHGNLNLSYNRWEGILNDPMHKGPSKRRWRPWKRFEVWFGLTPRSITTFRTNGVAFDVKLSQGRYVIMDEDGEKWHWNDIEDYFKIRIMFTRTVRVFHVCITSFLALLSAYPIWHGRHESGYGVVIIRKYNII